MSFCVYEIRTETGGLYIGLTKNFKKRIREHKCAANKGYDWNPIYDEIRKCNLEFDSKVLQEFEFEEDAKQYEHELIKKIFQRAKICNLDGRFASKYSRRSKLDAELKKKIRTKKIVAAHKKTGHFSRVGKIGAQRMKQKEMPVTFFCKETNEPIATFFNKIDLAQHLNLHWRSVYRYVSGQRNHKNFYFQEVNRVS